MSIRFDKLCNALLPLILVPVFASAAIAKSVGEAMSVVTDSEASDPNGFKLMIIAIGLLVFLAFSLIGVTIFYFAKNKKQSEK
jgi:hypothetical protein